MPPTPNHQPQRPLSPRGWGPRREQRWASRGLCPGHGPGLRPGSHCRGLAVAAAAAGGREPGRQNSGGRGPGPAGSPRAPARTPVQPFPRFTSRSVETYTRGDRLKAASCSHLPLERCRVVRVRHLGAARVPEKRMSGPLPAPTTQGASQEKSFDKNTAPVSPPVREPQPGPDSIRFLASVDISF